jgi:hypothetical protein
MTQYLDQPPEYYVGDLLEEYWGSVPPPVGGLSVQWQTSGDILIAPLWPSGDQYPIITLTNRDPTIPGGGTTNYTSKQGDGSGNNQERLENFLLTVHTDSAETYGSNNLSAERYAWRLLEHIHSIVEEHGDTTDSDIWSVYMDAPEGSIPNQGSTDVIHQEQATVTVHWNKTP